MSSDVNIDNLKEQARLFRRDILEVLNRAGSGHPGGSLSLVELLIGLYDYKMKHDPKNPKMEDRDRFIMSKGHASAALYIKLADAGYFPKEELEGYRTYGSRLQGHVVQKVPGVELNTGSLGHGLAVANGMGLAARMLGRKNNVYCIMGDGELQEGSVWESAMTSAHHKITNVCAIVDYNKVQENGPTNEIKNLEPLAAKWESFGWQAREIDGHNIEEVISALDEFETVTDKPYVIIAHTIKGKGVSFMEGDRNWHGKTPNEEKLQAALAELE